MQTYIITNPQTTELHIITSTDIRTWVINHLDMSLQWTTAPLDIKALTELIDIINN